MASLSPLSHANLIQKATAKNVCLAGVKSVTLYDPAPVEMADLGCQFFLRESDIGQPRDASTLPRLAELNRYVPVSVLKGQLDKEAINQFQVCLALLSHYLS